MVLDLAALQERAGRSAFNCWLGITVESVSDDAIGLGLLVRPDLLGAARGGTLHGGVISALVDVAGSLAILAQVGGHVATADLHVDYHRPSTSGKVQVRAWVVRAGRTLATGAAEIFGEDGLLLATGRGLYVRAAGPA